MADTGLGGTPCLARYWSYVACVMPRFVAPPGFVGVVDESTLLAQDELERVLKAHEHQSRLGFSILRSRMHRAARDARALLRQSRAQTRHPEDQTGVLPVFRTTGNVTMLQRARERPRCRP